MAISTIILSVALLGISSRMTTFSLAKSEEIFIKTDGCAEEALIQLNRDNSYMGGSYNIDDADCTVVVSGSGDNRNIAITGEEMDYTHDFSIDVQLSPDFAIINWTE